MIRSISLSTCACLLLLTAIAPAQTPAGSSSGSVVIPGELVIEPPTLINLGFEWFVQGDTNRNASVEMSFRKKGTEAWRAALPLLRLNGERIYAESRIDLVAPNMFAGSVLDLDPGTAYDIRLTMVDPDGVQGERSRIVTVSTRPEPQP